jgi:DNA-binding MarR family transcriptional regulator
MGIIVMTTTTKLKIQLFRRDGEMAEPRWLTEREQGAWRAFLRATRRLDEALDAQLQRDSGMPHAYYEILVRLSESPERRLRMAELADGTHSSPSRISHAVARLEERGWVRREPCASDRRGQLAVLTDEGFAALAEAAKGHVEQVRTSVFDALTERQIDQLEQIATRIADTIEGRRRPC